jgi:hypothetical protein
MQDARASAITERFREGLGGDRRLGCGSGFSRPEDALRGLRGLIRSESMLS